MRTLRCTIGALLAVALTVPASAAELTADQVIDRMVAANSAWLRADEVTSLSYVIERSHHGKPPAVDATIRVWYRAPRDLRFESEPGHKVLIWLDGRPFPGDGGPGHEYDATYVRDLALGPVTFPGACWSLANHRDKCQLLDVRHEFVDGRPAYRVAFKGYTAPSLGVGTLGPSGCNDHRDLWVDAETFRPMREAWNDNCTGPDHYSVLRYADWQPFPGGGEAPMRLERLGWPDSLPFDAEPPHKPWIVREYQIIDGKYWLLKTLRWYENTEHEDAAHKYGVWRSDDIRDMSLAPVPETVFKDEKEIARLERVAQLRNEAYAAHTQGRLEDFYRACDEFSAVAHPAEYAPAGAFEVLFWHGDYAKAIRMMPANQGSLELAWAYDAVGERQKALDLYRIFSRDSDGTVRPEVQRCLDEPWVPIAERLKPADGEQLVKPAGEWRAETNAGGDNPDAAIDGNRRTRWVTAESQRPDTWFQVDLDAPIKLRRIAFDFVGDLSVEYLDYPRRYILEVSADGRDWKTLAQGPGPRDNLVNVAFQPRQVRYLRMTQEGSHPRYPWAINEIFLYAPK